MHQPENCFIRAWNGSGGLRISMVRSQVSFTPEDEDSFRGVGGRHKDSEGYVPGEVESAALEDRIVDLDVVEQSPFLRGQKRVPVRHGPFQRSTANRLRSILLILAIALVAAAGAASVYRYGKNSWRFRVDSSDAIEIAGARNATRAQVLQVMGADLGRNVFFIPLDERKRQLEKIPWVETATVMRLLPNSLRIALPERTPIAFAKVGDRIALIDVNGVTMEMPLGGNYSFPVIVGNTESDPLSTRRARMKTYIDLVHQLDSSGANYSRELDEVDLSDPEDVKITVADQQGTLLIHLGSSSYLERFSLYKAHIQQWRQQFQRLHSVDLRFDRQVILNPGSPAPAAAIEQARQPGPKPIAAGSASANGSHQGKH
jgi:cell division protein FtsQ